MVKTEFIRSASLICGRWGNPDAKRVLSQRLTELRFEGQDESGIYGQSALRSFCSSVCFYWLLAGLIEADDWSGVGRLFEIRLRRSDFNQPIAKLVPLEIFRGADWSFLRDQQGKTIRPSDLLRRAFKDDAECIGATREHADNLFSECELWLLLQYVQIVRAERSFPYPVPFGSYLNRGDDLNFELEKLESLSSDDKIFSFGLLGGGRSEAKLTVSEIRKFMHSFPHQFG